MVSSISLLLTTLSTSHKHIFAIWNNTETIFIRTSCLKVKEGFIGHLLFLSKDNIGFNCIKEMVVNRHLMNLL